MALGHILETPPGQMPVVLAYKMNGQMIPAAHGGPVRVVVPGTYGSKSIKRVQRVVLTNDFKANDSDAESNFNNDTESPMKTRARFINAPREIPPEKLSALTGMAQIGISGLGKVQYCVHSQKEPWPADDPDWTKGDWKDAAVLPPPADVTRLSTGRHCSPACPRVVTTCAAAPSTATASPSPCHARCRGQALTPSTASPWS
jgi:DMSO/TMAO reductase YedYZ molybdopterin-dependent catalytic subunit